MGIKFKTVKNNSFRFLFDDAHGITSVYEKTDKPEGICIHNIEVEQKKQW